MVSGARLRTVVILGLAGSAALTMGQSCTQTPSGNGDGTSPKELTETQKQAVDSVVDQMETVGEDLGSFASVADPQAAADGDGSATFGTCPVVTAAGSANTVIVTLDYGDGCTNEFYGEEVLSGSIQATASGITQSLLVVFDNFKIDEEGVTGSVNVGRVEDTAAGATFTGSLDIATVNSGSAIGTATFSFNVQTAVITLSDAVLTLTDTKAVSYDVIATGIVMDPKSNGNFIPQSGTLSFDIPNDGFGPATLTVVVTFTSQSPVDGTVTVSIAGATPIEYQIPGVGDGEE